MGRVRYGARSEQELRNREVEATSVGAWAKVLTAVYEPDPPDGERTDFYFKFLPAPDGKGFDAEPSLVYCHRQETTRGLERVEGEVVLRDSRFDPVADIPVRKLREITWAERRSMQRGEI